MSSQQGSKDDEEDPEEEDPENAGAQSRDTRRVKVCIDPDVVQADGEVDGDGEPVLRAADGRRLNAEEIEQLQAEQKKTAETARKNEIFYALKDANYQVRRACVMKMKGLRAGTGSPDDIVTLVACLQRDDDEDVRAGAARAIWRLAKPQNTAAIHALVGAFADGDATVRSLALQAMEELTEAWDEEKVSGAPWYSPLILQLRELSRHAQIGTRMTTLEAICKVCTTCDKEALEIVLELLKKEPEWEARALAVKGVRQLAKKGDSGAISALAACLADPSGLVRVVASEALPHVAGREGLAFALAALAPHLKHKDSHVRHDVKEATTRIAIRCGAGNAMSDSAQKDTFVEESCVREALMAMTNKNAGVRHTGIETMRRLAEVRTPGVVEAVIQALQEAKTCKERYTALQALLQVSTPGDSLSFAAAIPCLQDPDSLVRHVATEVLEHTAPKNGAEQKKALKKLEEEEKAHVEEEKKNEAELQERIPRGDKAAEKAAEEEHRNMKKEMKKKQNEVIKKQQAMRKEIEKNEAKIRQSEQALCHELQHGSPDARLGAAKVLSKLTLEERLDGLAALAHCLEDMDGNLRLAAVNTLRDLSVAKSQGGDRRLPEGTPYFDRRQEVIDEAMQRLGHPEWVVRKAVAEVLSAPGLLQVALPTLSSKLAHKDESIRRNAVEVLVALAEEDPRSTLPITYLLLTHPLEDTRLGAVEVVHRIAPRGATHALQALAPLLAENTRVMRTAVLLALSDLASQDYPELVQSAAPFLNDRDVSVRNAAVKVIGVVASDTETIVHLRAHLEDQDAKVRLATIRAMIQIGERIGCVDMAASAVRHCLKDHDERVREAAAEVVFSYGTEPAVPFSWLALESTKQ